MRKTFLSLASVLTLAACATASPATPSPIAVTSGKTISAPKRGDANFPQPVPGGRFSQKIKAVKTGSRGFHQDVPKEDVLIVKAELI